MRKSPAQILADLGATRDEIEAAAKGLIPYFIQRTTFKLNNPRPVCLVCGKPIGKRTCQPYKA